MPKIDLTFTAGALSDEAKRELPSRMARSLLKWEKAPDNEFFRSIAWTHVHELPPGAAHTADGPATLSQFIVEVTVPGGAFSQQRREGMVSEMSQMIKDAAALGDDELIRVWILVSEIAEGSWGAGGNVVYFEQLREQLRQQKTAAV